MLYCFLKHPDLTAGQKKYLGTICAAYSTSQMKSLVQDQYLKQLWYEAEKGVYCSLLSKELTLFERDVVYKTSDFVNQEE